MKRQPDYRPPVESPPCPAPAPWEPRETAAEAVLRAARDRDVDEHLRRVARERHQADAEFRRSVRWVAICIAVACICTALAVWSLR